MTGSMENAVFMNEPIVIMILITITALTYLKVDGLENHFPYTQLASRLVSIVTHWGKHELKRCK